VLLVSLAATLCRVSVGGHTLRQVIFLGGSFVGVFGGLTSGLNGLKLVLAFWACVLGAGQWPSRLTY
jgi:hypothetical protein